MVGWKSSLFHRAPLVNWPPPRCPPPPPIGFPSLCLDLHMSSPASKCPAQQIFETLQVNHKTEKLPPPPLQTQRGWGGGAEPRRQQERLLSEQATVTPERLLLMINNLPPHERESERGREGERETLSHSPQELSSKADGGTLHLPRLHWITWILPSSTQRQAPSQKDKKKKLN